MRAVDARTIPIDRYLELEGHKPKRSRAKELWYCSPIRGGDSSPSFKVDTGRNIWFDHGAAKGGNIIDLVIELKNVTVSEALKILENTGLYGAPSANNLTMFHVPEPKQAKTPEIKIPRENFAGENKKEGSGCQILKVGEIEKAGLIDYLEQRRIDLDIARHYLKEIHFTFNNQLRAYYALGWPNGNGFDARNAFFKGFVGTGKTISTLNMKPDLPVAIFEGPYDFLALLSHKQYDKLPFAAIILHAVSLRKQAIEAIKEHASKRVFLFLDNDDAGRDTADFFSLALPDHEIHDYSSSYGDYKDFNERWIDQR